MTAPAADNRIVNLALIAGLAAWGAALWPLHDLLPMWVEGLGAYLDQLLGILRRACTPPVNAVEIGGRFIPLAIDAYQGPLMTYLDVPVARAWLGSLTDNLYAYRYKGIVLLAISGYLLYVLLRRLAPPAIAALGAMVFVTLPANAVTAISDLQFHVPLLVVILAMLIAAANYAQTQRSAWLFVAAFAAGVALLTRAEALIWTAAAAMVWMGLDRRAQVASWWRTTPHKLRLGVSATAAFALGAAPIVVMNLLHPSYGLLNFLLVGGPTRVIESGSLVDALVARTWQFFDFILLNRFAFYSTAVADVAYMGLAVAAALCLTRTAVRERRWPFALVAIAVVLPLSALGHRHIPREIHLLPLAIPVIAIVTEVSGRLRWHYGSALLGAALVANIVVGGLVLAHWQSLQADGKVTMLNHSCPECLAKALAPYLDASLRFTNIGLYQEALWASRAHACGEDILNWGDDTGFAAAVRNAIGSGSRVVFVGYPKEREDALTGRVLRRADALAATVRAAGVDFREERVAGPDGLVLYQLTVVSASPSRLVVTGAGINAPTAGRITGWIQGRGFRPDDRVGIDGIAQSPYFAHAGLVTFSVEAAAYASRDTMVVEMIGADGTTRSAALTLPLR